MTLDRALLQVGTLESRKRGAALGPLIKRWRRRIEDGTNFGQCLAPYVPSGEAILLEAGSKSGFLQKALETAADMVDQQRRIKSKIISASAYPGFLIMMLIGIMLLAAYNIIPTFEEVLPVEQWRGISAVVASVSSAIRDFGIIYLGVFFGIIGFIAMTLPRWTGKSRLMVESLVPWNVYRMWQGASFMLSVASLLSAGVKLDEVSLKKISERASPYLRERIRAVSRRLSSGENLGEALYKTGYHFPNDEFIADLQIYATLKGFEKNLEQITKDWVNDVEAKVGIMMKVLNVIALMLVSVVIIVLGAALYGVVDQIQSSTSTV